MASNIEDYRNTASKEIAALQQEVSKLQKMISAQTADAYYEMRERTNNVVDAALPKAKNAAAQIKAESKAAAGAALDHPAATTTALALAGVAGVVLGYLLGSYSQQSQAQSRYWWQQ